MKINRNLFYILCFVVFVIVILVLNIKIADSPIRGYIMNEEDGLRRGEYRSEFGYIISEWDCEYEIKGCLKSGEIYIFLLDGGFADSVNDYDEEDIISQWTISETGNFDLVIEVGDAKPSSRKTVVIKGSEDVIVSEFREEQRIKSKLYQKLFG